MKKFFTSFILIVVSLRICVAQLPCTSIGDSSFEYIQSIGIEGSIFETGNNDGYLSFEEEIIVGKRQINLTLSPGHNGQAYREFWTIYMDRNNDGNFEESEFITKTSGIGTLIEEIILPQNFVDGATLRISMQYNTYALPCADVSFGEVEDYKLYFQDIPCDIVISNDFENGYDSWIDGGTDCSIVTDLWQQDNKVLRLRDDSPESVATLSELDFEKFEYIVLNFDFYGHSMENGEVLYLESKVGNDYEILESWKAGIDFKNDVIEYYSDRITKPQFINELRFRLSASSNGDQVYIDNFMISGCSSPNIESIQQDIDNEKVEEIVEQEEEPPIDIDIAVYPNPSSDYMSIDINGLDESQIRLYIADLYGSQKEIKFNTHGSKLIIDLDQYKNGTYLLTVINADKIIATEKLLIYKQ